MRTSLELRASLSRHTGDSRAGGERCSYEPLLITFHSPDNRHIRSKVAVIVIAGAFGSWRGPARWVQRWPWS
jgi:hypothetical protein